MVTGLQPEFNLWSTVHSCPAEHSQHAEEGLWWSWQSINVRHAWTQLKAMLNKLPGGPSKVLTLIHCSAKPAKNMRCMLKRLPLGPSKVIHVRDV